MLNPPSIPVLLAELSLFRKFMASFSAAADDLWQRRPSPGEWSLNEIACHLRDVEIEVHQTRLRSLLAEDGAFLPGVDADEWAMTRDYYSQDGRVALVDFVTARDKTITLLTPLPADVWERQGQHTFFGPTSLREIVFLAVRHDRVHAGQIQTLAAD